MSDVGAATHVGPPADRGARAALLVCSAVLVAAFPVLLALGRYRWFLQDEWYFLASRDGGDVGDLLVPHNEHWSTLPILVYRGLFRLVGLQSYLPYRAILVVLHLTVAALLRLIMRRAGVGPWIATAAASLFVFFGSGHQNILFAFQMGFVGSLVFGLVHLLLADHDGPVDRRDWLALLAGFAGLLCSGVAVTMTVVVGLATLARRGWRAALLHTVPLGAVYGVWFVTTGRDYVVYDVSAPGEVARFVTTGARAAFDGMGQVRGAGWALGALLVVGLVLAWGRLGRAERHRRAAAPGALLIGAFLVLCISGLGRAAAFGPGFARQSRYLHVFAALALPALAVAAQAVARRLRWLAPVVFALLLVGIPGNVDVLVDLRRNDQVFFKQYRTPMLTLPRLPLAHKLPRSVRPEQSLAKSVTLGWLLDGVAAGRLPEPRLGRVDVATAYLHLALSQQPWGVLAICRNATTPAELRFDARQSIGIHGVVQVVYVTETGVRSRPVEFDPANLIITDRGVVNAPRLVALTGPLTLEVESVDPSRTVALCVSFAPMDPA